MHIFKFQIFKYAIPFVFFLISTPIFLSAQSLKSPSLQEFPEEIFIVEFFLKDIFLDEAFVIYQKEGKLFLPISEFFDRLKIKIDVDVKSGVAQGWFLEKDLSFSLFVKDQKVTLGSSSFFLKQGEIIWGEEDILLSKEILEEIFPFQIEFLSYSQTLVLKSFQPLPMEEKLERQKKANSIKKNQLKQEADQWVSSKYELFSVPNTDIRLISVHNDQTGQTNSNLTTLSRGDLFYSTFNLFTASNEDNGLRSVRTSIGKKDPNSNLLDFLNASEYELGDVFTPQTDLINRSNYGYGFLVNNFPLANSRNPGTFPINGNLEPNWEVELYRNDQLLDYQITDENGRYDFQEVPLVNGLNVFTLKFYGPTGEKRERSIRYYYNAELPQKNTFFYSLVSNRHRENVYTSNPEKEVLENDESSGKLHQVLDLEYGVNRYLSLKGGRVSAPIFNKGVLANYNRLGLKTSLFGVFAIYDYVEHEESGGNAEQLSFSTKFGKSSLLAKFRRFFGEYDSDQRLFTENSINEAVEFRFDSIINIFDRKNLFYTISQQKNFLEQGSIETSQFNLTLPLHNYSLSNRYFRTVTVEAGGNANVVSNTVASIRNNINKRLSIRADLSYDIQPTAQYDFWSFRANYKLTENSNVDARYFYFFSKEDTTGTTRDYSDQYSLQYNQLFEDFTLGLIYAELNQFKTFTLNFTSSLGKNSIQGDWITSSNSLTSQGIVTARVFLDENGDEVFDENDTPLSNVRIKVDRRTREQKTNKKGIVGLEQIPTYQLVSVEIDEGSLKDPYWNAMNKKQFVSVHPGSNTMLNFIVQRTGEIEGIVEVSKGTEVEGIGGVKVVLYDRFGRVVKTTETLFDGFFLFDRIPLGEYFVEVSKKQLKQFNYKLVSENQQSFRVKEEEVGIANFTIKKI